MLEETRRRDVMVDLETLDTTCTSAILAIGACEFNIETGEILKSFESGVNRLSAVEFGTVSLGTLEFWLKQDQFAFDRAMNGKLSLESALMTFSEWFTPGAYIWGNGSSFDLGILGHAYLRCPGDHKVPWDHWNERDVRTIVDLADGLVDRENFEFGGRPHVAVDDAVHQATYVSAMYKALKDLRGDVVAVGEGPEDKA